jgi:hypothetical protein
MFRLILRLDLESVIRPSAAVRPHHGQGLGRDDTERDAYREKDHGDRDQQAAHD